MWRLLLLLLLLFDNNNNYSNEFYTLKCSSYCIKDKINLNEHRKEIEKIKM